MTINAQIQNPSPGDWTTQVQKDMKLLKIDQTIEQLTTMRKKSFKKYINTKVKEHTYKELMRLKSESKN